MTEFQTEKCLFAFDLHQNCWVRSVRIMVVSGERNRRRSSGAKDAATNERKSAAAAHQAVGIPGKSVRKSQVVRTSMILT